MLIINNNIFYSPNCNKSMQKFSNCITDSFSSNKPMLADKGSSRKKYCLIRNPSQFLHHY